MPATGRVSGIDWGLGNESLGKPSPGFGVGLDVSRYLELFLTDAREHVGVVETSLARLESCAGEVKGDEVRAILDECFRRLHSLKSSAAMMGFEPVSRLAHLMEELVEKVRGRESLLRPVLDVLIEASTALGSLVEHCARGSTADVRISETVVASLTTAIETLNDASRRSALANAPSSANSPSLAPASSPGFGPSGNQEVISRARSTPPPTSPASHEPSANATCSDSNAIVVRIRISERAAAPAARAFLAVRQLGSLATVRSTEPPLAALKAGEYGAAQLFSDGILVHLDGSPAQVTQDHIRERLARLPEIEQVEIFCGDEQCASRSREVAAEAEPPPLDRATLKPTEQSVKVKVELLDKLLELAGELVLASSRVHDTARLAPMPLRETLEEHSDRLRLLVKEVNNRVLAARQSPIQLLADRLPLVVRELSRRLDRRLSLQVEGAEVTMDRGLIDALAEPLLHAVRNSVDHGIEPPDERLRAGKPEEGRLVLAAQRERDRVVLELRDDGRGFDANRLRDKAVRAGALTREAADALDDAQALRLAFLPGLSTRDQANDISGRGVGMDAVLQVTEQLGGTVVLESVPGQGSTVRFVLPATVSVMNLLLLRLGDEVLGLPMGRVLFATEGPCGTDGRRTLELNGEQLPAWDLGRLVGFPTVPRDGLRPWVVVDADGKRAAFGVDALIGQEEVVLRPLGMPLDRIRGLAGTAILGSGRPVFVLDVPRLVA